MSDDKYVIYSIVFLILVQTGCASSSNTSSEIEVPRQVCITEFTAGVVQECIKKNGAAGIAGEIAKSNMYQEQLFNNIRNGKNEWLNLVPDLYSGSDASFTTGIYVSLGQALDSNTEDALKTIVAIERQNLKKRNEYKLDSIATKVCSEQPDNWDDSDPTYKKIAPKALALLKAREKKIDKIDVAELKEIKSDCISEIRKSETMWMEKIKKTSLKR